jgi:hypothetical protein
MWRGGLRFSLRQAAMVKGEVIGYDIVGARGIWVHECIAGTASLLSVQALAD